MSLLKQFSDSQSIKKQDDSAQHVKVFLQLKSFEVSTLHKAFVNINKTIEKKCKKELRIINVILNDFANNFLNPSALRARTKIET